MAHGTLPFSAIKLLSAFSFNLVLYWTILICTSATSWNGVQQVFFLYIWIFCLLIDFSSWVSNIQIIYPTNKIVDLVLHDMFNYLLWISICIAKTKCILAYKIDFLTYCILVKTKNQLYEFIVFWTFLITWTLLNFIFECDNVKQIWSKLCTIMHILYRNI